MFTCIDVDIFTKQVGDPVMALSLFEILLH